MKKITLVEILLIVTVVALLATLGILFVNPKKQQAEYRDGQRLADMQTTINAVYQYKWDTDKFPATITDKQTEICKTDVPACTGMVDLSILTNKEAYLRILPSDPLAKSINGTGYLIQLTSDKRIKISAPHAENNIKMFIVR